MGTRDWQVAALKVAAAMKVTVPVAPVAPVAATASRNPQTGYPLAECFKMFLESREHEIDDITHRRYVMLFDRLGKYAAESGVVMANGLGADLLERFKVEGIHGEERLSMNTKSCYVASMKKFLRVAYKRKWISEPLHEDIDRIVPPYEEVQPFTKEETARLLAGCLTVNVAIHYNGYARQPIMFQLVIKLALETGMRIGDCIAFDPARLTKSNTGWAYKFTMQKTKKADAKRRKVTVFITNGLHDAIMAAQVAGRWLNPTRTFDAGAATYQQIYTRMQKIGETHDIPDSRPHRLRETMAARFLENSGTLDALRRLLGHVDLKTTQMHYDALTQGKEDGLEAMVAAAGTAY